MLEIFTVYINMLMLQKLGVTYSEPSETVSLYRKPGSPILLAIGTNIWFATSDSSLISARKHFNL